MDSNVFIIISLIEYNNIYFAENNRNDLVFETKTLNIYTNTKDMDLLLEDYIKIEEYNQNVYRKFEKLNNILDKNIILLNLDQIVNKMTIIIDSIQH